MFLRIFVRANASNQDIEWAHGVIPVTTDAFTAGAVPLPAVDFAAWYLFDGGFFSAGTNARDDQVNKEYDIRSGRRIRDRNTTLMHSMHNTSAGISLVYGLTSNCLVQLP